MTAGYPLVSTRSHKKDVGLRLSRWALAKTYAKPIAVYSGPIVKSYHVDGSRVKITFDHVGSGLVSRDGQPLSHFEIAGADKKFVPAIATIDGGTVVVSAQDVDMPKAVRFAWIQTAQPNLSNKEGLPAIPFRTDNWAVEPAPEPKKP